MFLTAEFVKPEPAADGVSALLAEGFDTNSIDIFSDRPVELVEDMLRRRSSASLVAVLGAIINGGLATGFIIYTQHDYPLVTGGMPLVSGWATGVISYELTMAGAVAGAVLAFLWEAGLFRRRKGRPPTLKDGSIFLRVECPDDAATTVTDCLSSAGAVEITRQETA
jgi:hypothetical protein